MGKRLLRVFAPLAMLLVFLFGNFGTFMLYNSSEIQNREKVNKLLEKNNEKDLTVLEVPLKEVRNKNIFVQNSRDEIFYKGHLYDVAGKEITKDNIIFYCINDKQEESLNTQLNEQVKALFDATPAGKSSAKTFSKNLLSEFMPITASGLNVPRYGTSADFNYCISSYGDVYSEIFSPPPSLV